MSRAQRPLHSLNSLMAIRYFFGFKAAVAAFDGRNLAMHEDAKAVAAGALRRVPPRNPQEHTRRCNERATAAEDCTCGANMGECSICRREHGPEVQHACE